MATDVSKIDSNVTGLSYAEETSIKVLPGTPTWNILEPNSYNDFGSQVSKTARNPINVSRQNKKGVTTDLDASGGFNIDFTQTNLEDILQGFFFADLRPKGEEVVTSVTTLYLVASTTGIKVGDLIFASGFTNAGNNGFTRVSAIVADTSIGVDATLVTEGSPPAAAKVVVVGVEGAAGDIDVDSTGSLPTLTSTTLDFTTLGLNVGEPIFVGGDAAGDKFSTAANNGRARVKTIAANVLTLDKSAGTMVTEASTTETVQLFFGRVLKNENTSALIKRRSYNLERKLGAPDTALPSNIQSEYIIGAVANEMTLNFGTADKITVDLGFIASDSETRTGVTGVKSGNRPALVASDAYNTTNDFTGIKLSLLDAADSNPTALYAFLTEFSITINNNASPNKAIGTLGAFDITAGQFTVGGSVTAYFADTPAIDAVRNNSDTTLDFMLSNNNTGIAVDVPLISLGDGRLNVEQDAPITIPLDVEAAADVNFDHTLMISFFDFLPNAADV